MTPFSTKKGDKDMISSGGAAAQTGVDISLIIS
jgi:hypothetical protein